MTDLPPFDPKPTCPKCGGTRIRVFWQQGITDPVNGRDLPECVIRTCKRCHYDWRELPLDATPADHADCDHRDGSGSAVYWNPYNGVVQCHRCGVIFEPTQTIAVPFAADVAVAGEPAEPSIPVSRIVAVLAEQLLIVERVAAQKEDPLWRDWYAITNIAEILGIHGPVMAELARQRKEA